MKCELCGTTKSLDLPFEITKCRQIDQSIIENMTRKMIDSAKSRLECRASDKKCKQINQILSEINLFVDKFSKWSKFNRYVWNDFRHLMDIIGNTDFLKHFRLEELDTK